VRPVCLGLPPVARCAAQLLVLRHTSYQKRSRWVTAELT
jgi:hypothetical protein